MELGLRYRPLGAADQEAHTAQVALLAKDLAGVDPDKLTRAAQEYARTERFMPKACDLLAIIQKGAHGSFDPEALAAKGNAHLDQIGRYDVRWRVVNGQPEIGWAQ
jgi:hypothetical protein